MLKSRIVAIVTLAACAVPAFAEDYYIVHGSDRHCRVVERMPEDNTIIRVGPLRFATRDEAERQVRLVCSDNGDYREQEHREGERREERREDRGDDHREDRR